MRRYSEQMKTNHFKRFETYLALYILIQSVWYIDILLLTNNLTNI